MPAMHPSARGFDSPLLYRTARAASLISAATQAESDHFADHGVSRERIITHPFGIRLTQTPSDPDSRWPDKKVVLFAGAKNHEKGAFHVLDAAMQLGAMKEIQFVFIGGDTRKWARLREKGLPANVCDLGFVSAEEKAALFARCDVFVMPSRAESFGRGFVEAWQGGKPVIGCDIPAVRHVVDMEQDGILIPFGDVAALAAGIKRLTDNEALRTKFGEHGRNKVAEKFDCRTYAAAMEHAMLRVVEEHKRNRA